MVLCSIEEAWGSDFNQNFKYNPGTSQTYKKKNNQPSKNRYRYNFHRSSEPLPNHNGSYRDQNVFDVTLDNNKPLEEEYQFENQSNSNNNNLTPIEYDNNPNQNKIYNSAQKNLAKKTNNDLVPFYDNDEDENYENFDSQSNNENSDDEFDITKLNRHYDKKKMLMMIIIPIHPMILILMMMKKIMKELIKEIMMRIKINLLEI